MKNLFYNISQVLGVTVIHSLWQGLLIYVALQFLLLSVPRLTAVKKYNLSAIALFGMAFWFIYTFYTGIVACNWGIATGSHIAFNKLPGNLSFSAINPVGSFKTAFFNAIKKYLPYISFIYTIGLLINLGKLGLAWHNIRVIKRGMILAENLQPQINAIAHKLAIKRKVTVSFSRLIDVPCVIGCLKPILLLPITLTFQLSAVEIEAIILHELSHIKKNDFLVNLVQQIITILLFFNPFAQLISRMINTEREHRCDDTVVESIGNPLTYAYALLKLEENRQVNLNLALAATKNKHHLLTRIERIMKTNKPIGTIRPVVLTVMLLTLSLGSIAWLNPEMKNGKLTFKTIVRRTVTQPTGNLANSTSINHKLPAAHLHKTKWIATADTVKAVQFKDTTKKKIKIVVEDENGNKQEYNSVNDMPESVRNDFYKENGNANLFFNDTLNRKFFNNPQWKAHVKAMQEQAMVMSKKMNSPRFKEQMEAMKQQGKKMEKYYNSPEWKAKVEAMQKNAAETEKYYNSPEWEAKVEEMQKKGEEMGNYFNSPEWKKQVEELAKQGEEFGKNYVNSPEFKKMQEDIVKNAMEIAKQFSGQKWDNVDGTPVAPKVKKVLPKDKKADKVKAEKPEAKEKPEQPEKPEAPEQPEQ